MYLANPVSHAKSHQGGLALIEVLLALGLSSVMFLALFSAQVHNQKVLIYSQQLHYANRMLDQVTKQVWAYPNYYQSLISKGSQGDQSCLNGRYCNPATITKAWAAYWQAQMLQQLPNGELSLLCNSSCTRGGSLLVTLSWSQSLAVATDQCVQGVACIDLTIAL